MSGSNTLHDWDQCGSSDLHSKYGHKMYESGYSCYAPPVVIPGMGHMG